MKEDDDDDDDDDDEINIISNNSYDVNKLCFKNIFCLLA